MVTVTYGSNSSDLEGFEGQTVGAVRAAFASIGVSASDAATLNGATASDADVLRAGDELRFVKQLAQKG